MPVSHPIKKPATHTDPVKPDLLRRGEWWCHVAPSNNQVQSQLGPFLLNLEGLPKDGPNRYWCSITAMIQGSQWANVRLVIRKELGDPSVPSQNGWGSGTGGDHDTMTISDAFHNLERARYTVWLTANQGYFNQIRYIVHIVQQPARDANEMAIVGADETAVVGLDQPEPSSG